MFERYTDSARRLLFFARHEASQSGSPFVETEHFFLAVLKEEKDLLPRLLEPDLAGLVEQEIRQTLAVTASTQQNIDIPLSHSVKRVLVYGAEAAQALNDPHIRSEHLLLGLLKDTDCLAVRVLEKYGITRERVLREMGVEDTSAMDRLRPKVTRETLNALVATLPEGAFDQAYAHLTHLQVWPPLPPQIPPRIAELQKEMHERFQSSIRPGTGMGSGSGGGWSTDSQGKLRDGSFSSSRIENGVRVTETHRFFQGHEITTIESLQLKAENKTLSYSQEIHGPNREHHFEIDFEIG